MLMIARSLIKNAPIVIFDEATSALDSVTELSVTNSIKESYHSKTLIIISHRLSAITFCNKILFFEKGKIVEAGSHEELINKKGKYYHMWNLQT